MSLSPSAQKVQDALQALGLGHLQVQELSASTRTAQEAAAAVGCTVGQIVKSLIFVGQTSQQPYLLLVSGPNRVDVHAIEVHLSEKLSKPNADYVRQVTGFAIGGVPPFGHHQPLTALLDPDLLNFERIFAAAGTPNAIFGLSPQELLQLCQAQVLQQGIQRT